MLKVESYMSLAVDMSYRWNVLMRNSKIDAKSEYFEEHKNFIFIFYLYFYFGKSLVGEWQEGWLLFLNGISFIIILSVDIWVMKRRHFNSHVRIKKWDLKSAERVSTSVEDTHFTGFHAVYSESQYEMGARESIVKLPATLERFCLPLCFWTFPS